MSERYALRSAAEARAYLAHPILGRRNRECVSLVDGWLAKGRTAEAIRGG
jgi:uncharacterized protein (DUF1810 family)